MSNPRLKKGAPSLNPNGRPKGSKNKFPRGLGEKVLHACNHLESIGKSLTVMAEEEPKWFFETFVKAMLPKDLQIRQIKSVADLTDEEKIALAESLINAENQDKVG